jgi:hypothetical protein
MQTFDETTTRNLCEQEATTTFAYNQTTKRKPFEVHRRKEQKVVCYKRVGEM